jgi:N-acetylmuramoyl-L-alanine amidase
MIVPIIVITVNYKLLKWGIYMISRRLKRSIICTALVLGVGAAAIVYAAGRMDDSVMVSTTPENQTIIVLDAGHGGIDGGCSTADGQVEKTINLNILLTTRDMARLFGYEVETTRDTDKSIHDKGVTGIRNQKLSDMDNRLEIFNMHNNAVCVSIHQNTYTDPKFSGAQMFYSDTNENNERLASLMQRKFMEYIQPNNNRETKLCGSELFLCYYCNNPTLMIECGFLSNPEEAAKLTSKPYQQQVAFTIFSGLDEFIKN